MADWMDETRRSFGRALDAFGFGPQLTARRVLAEWPGARLSAYHPAARATGPVLLIVAAPFKRAYIWDLLPDVSVVRRCVERGLRVYLLEWLTPTQAEDEFGLADYAFRLPGLALEVVAAETGSAAPILAGHSLGGTFAAIVAALAPERVGGLVLVDAPLAFGEDGGPLAEAVRAMPPMRRIREAAGSPVPGSVINALSMGAAPDAFGGQRLSDFVASLLDLRALAIHARVERWTYDEFPLPGRLFEETLEGLYREDRFRAGTLPVGQRRAMLATLRAPVVAVVNPVGRVVPPASVLKGLEAAKPASVEILTYEGDRGPVLQHLGPLVAPAAHERLWPRILDWAEALAR